MENDDRCNADFLRGARFGVLVLGWILKATLLKWENDPARALAVAQRIALSAIDKRTQFEKLQDLDLTTVA